VTRLNAAGSAVLYSTYLGGGAADNCFGLALDPPGSTYVVGDTTSTDFPTTPGAFDTFASGGFDVFVAKIGEPAAAALDHFKCYDGKFPRFQPREVRLVDQFDRDRAIAFRAELFCNPVSKNDEPIRDRDAHLKLYAIRPAPGHPPFRPRSVIVTDQFGEERLRVVHPAALALPAQKLPHRPPEGLDHFKCYNVEPIAGTPAFQPREVVLRDQFDTERVRVVAPRLLCTPVSKNEEPVHDPVTHLKGYVIEPIEQPKIDRTVVVRDQFGTETVRVRRARLLLVPAEKRLLKTPDQINDPESGTSFGCGDTGLSLYQGFTPTVSPLVAVDLRLRAGGSFPAGGTVTTVNLRGGTPAGPVLGTATAFVPGPQPVGAQFLIQLHFAPPIAVTPGATYVIEWLSPGPPGVPADAILTWMGREDDPYPGGNAFGCTAIAAPEDDFNFVSYTD
jgi:hypothetical protein